MRLVTSERVGELFMAVLCVLIVIQLLLLVGLVLLKLL